MHSCTELRVESVPSLHRESPSATDATKAAATGALQREIRQLHGASRRCVQRTLVFQNARVEWVLGKVEPSTSEGKLVLVDIQHYSTVGPLKLYMCFFVSPGFVV